MADLRARLVDEKVKDFGSLSYDQLQTKATQALAQFETRNQMLAKKANQQNDVEFMKTFDRLRGQMSEEMKDLQTILMALKGKAKMTTQKNAFNRLQGEVQSSMEKFINNMKKLKNSSFVQRRDDRQSSMLSSHSAASGGRESFQGDNSGASQVVRVNEEWVNVVDIETNINQERQIEIDKAERDFREINEIFNQMGKQIVEDGEDLKAIEENIDDAHVQVVAAEKEITQANKYQKKSTRKYWIFAFIILVALGVIFALVFT